MIEHGIGLDLATHVTGVFHAYDDTLAGAQLIKVPSKDANDWERMADSIIDYLDRTPPTYVCLESVFLGHSPKTLIQLAMLHGSVRTWCRRNAVLCYVATTAEIDARCNIEHKGRKAQIRDFAKMLGFDLPQDAADALAILYWGKGEHRYARLVAQAEGQDDDAE